MLKDRIRAYCAQGWRVVTQTQRHAKLSRSHREKTLEHKGDKIIERNFTTRTGLDMPVEIDF